MKMALTLQLLFVCVLAFPLYSQTCTNNLLQNPGFESGLTGWSGDGAIAPDAYSGANAITVCQTDENVRQTFAATPGATYTLQLWAKNGSPDMQTLGHIKFLNSSWQPIDNEYAFAASADWAFYTVGKAAPADAVWVEVSVQKSGSGAGCAFADAVCFTSDDLPPDGGGGTASCDVNIGTGSIQCVDAIPGSTDFQVMMYHNNTLYRKTISASGQLLQSEDLGPLPPPSGVKVEIVSNNSVRKTNADGSIAYVKPFPAALLNIAGTFSQVVETGNDGFVILAWKPQQFAPFYIRDTVVAIKTDMDLNVLKKKSLTTGTGYPGDNNIQQLAVLNPEYFAFFQNKGSSTNQALDLHIFDAQLNLKATKHLANNVFSASGNIIGNVCRGFSATDNLGFGYCKSGACYQVDRYDFDMVADTLQTYYSSLYSEHSSLGVGVITYKWLAKTTDGGRLMAVRKLEGVLAQVVNDTLSVSRYNNSGGLIWQKIIVAPNANAVIRFFEHNGQVFLFKTFTSGAVLLSNLDCYEPAPTGCADNLVANAGFENALDDWEGTGATLVTDAAAGNHAVQLCQNANLRQTRPATIGETFELAFKAKGNSGDSKVLSYIKYLGDSWQPIATGFFEFAAPTTGYSEATVTQMAPAGTTWVETGFLVEKDGCVLLDDVCLSKAGASSQSSRAAANRKDANVSAAASDLLLYPNPASNSVTIGLSGWVGKPAHLSLINHLGQTVLEKTWDLVENAVETVSLDRVVSGPYFVKMETQGERVILRKLIVKN